MNIEKFTDKARESISDAQGLAAGMGHQGIDTGHLALALVRQDRGIVPSILEKMGVPLKAFAVALEEMLKKRPSVSGSGMDPTKVMLTPELAKCVTQAQEEAKKMQDEYVSVDHLFCALTDVPPSSPLGKVLGEYKISRVSFVQAMESLRGGRRVIVVTMGTGVSNPQGELDSNASKGVRNRTISTLVEQSFSALAQ